jgi:Coenzyme PQQ synthesis protein D (PqqD)
MDLMTEGTISRSNGWLASWIGDELMMMSADSSAYLSLSGTGGRIWELLEEPRTLNGLCEALAAEYDVQPAEVRGEVEGFLERLQEQHAIEIHPAALA